MGDESSPGSSRAAHFILAVRPELAWLNWQVWSEDGFLRWASFHIEVNTPKFDNNFAEKPGPWKLEKQPLGTHGPAMGFPRNLRPRWDTSTGFFAPFRRDVIGSRFVGIIVPYWILLR